LPFACLALGFLLSGSGIRTCANPDTASRLFLFYDGHPGYDYKTTDQDPSGQIPVLAVAAGTVICVNISVTPTQLCHEGPGEIKIDHGNRYFTIYLHLSSSSVRAGDLVANQQQIGISGSTGVCTQQAPCPHLHFEVRKGAAGSTCLTSKCVPVDPYGWRGGNWTAPQK
jgi:murein DD-endopeptidase MepM/ murein hydrolase activator NlpD